MVSHKMLLKVRTEPFSVYLRYLAPYEGREVIYVEGQNKGQLLAHDVGVKALVGTVSLLPTSRRAMDESRYPITKIGMQALLDLTIEQWESELAHDEIDVKYFPNAKIGEVECKVIQTSHSEPRKHFRFHMTRLYIDRSTNLPVRIEQFGWPAKDGDNPPIIEEYTYLNLKANVGLKDIDFDTRNPSYGY
jgi:hypothetical protein